jgi:hypothetical protein
MKLLTSKAQIFPKLTKTHVVILAEITYCLHTETFHEDIHLHA